MRIQPTSKSLPADPLSPAQPESTPAPSRRGSDRVELSALSQAAAGLSPDRLKEIQAALDAGTYEINPAKISRSIVEFYLTPLKLNPPS